MITQLLISVICFVSISCTNGKDTVSKINLPDKLHGYYNGKDTIQHIDPNKETLLLMFNGGECIECYAGHLLMWRSTLSKLKASESNPNFVIVFNVKSEEAIEELRLATFKYRLDHPILVDSDDYIVQNSIGLQNHLGESFSLIKKDGSVPLTTISCKSSKEHKDIIDRIMENSFK